MGELLDRVLARARTDMAFRRRLVDEPVATLRAEGVAVPDGVTVTAVEETASHRHLVLPPRAAGELSDEDLDGVSGGARRRPSPRDLLAMIDG